MVTSQSGGFGVLRRSLIADNSRKYFIKQGWQASLHFFEPSVLIRRFYKMSFVRKFVVQISDVWVEDFQYEGHNKKWLCLHLSKGLTSMSHRSAFQAILFTNPVAKKSLPSLRKPCR